MAIFFQENWPTVKTNSGAFLTDDHYERPFPPYSGTDSQDADYPYIVLSEQVKVSSGGGPDGENCLDIDATPSNDWLACAATMWGFGTEESRPSNPVAGLTNAYSADVGRWSIDYKFDASAWSVNTNMFYCLLSDNGFPFPVAVYADFDPSEGVSKTFFRVQVGVTGWVSDSYEYVTVSGGGTPTFGGAGVRDFTDDDYKDVWYRIRVEFKCGTIDGFWDDVASDGFVRVFLTNLTTDVEELIYERTGIDLYATPYTDVIAHQSRQVAIGFYGQFGRTTNLVMDDELELTPTVQTLPATLIRPTTVQLNGTVDPNGTTITGRFKWDTVNPPVANTTANQALGAGQDPVQFLQGLTGLNPNTTYYFRALANALEGEVFSFTTSEDVTFVDGVSSHPVGWQRLLDRGLTWRPFAEVDLNDAATYYNGYKKPSIVEFLRVTRGLSDQNGQMEHMAFGARHSDTDYFWRTLINDPALKYLTNRPLLEHIIDDEDRRLEGLALLVANGYVSDYTTLPNMQFQIVGTDWLKRKYSRSLRAQLTWQPTIELSHFPNCPAANVGMPAPIIYGSPCDDLDGVVSGAAAVRMAINTGVPGGYYPFSRGLSGPETGGYGSTLVPGVDRSYGFLPGSIPTNLTLTASAGGSLPASRNHSWSAMVTAIHGGIESDPSPVANVQLAEGWDAGARSFTANWTAAAGGADGGYNLYVTNNPFGVDTKMSTHFTPFHVASDYMWVIHLPSGTTTRYVEVPGNNYTFEQVKLYQVSAILPGGVESSPSGVTIGMSHPYARPIHLRWWRYDGALGYRIRRADFQGVGVAPNWNVSWDVGPYGAGENYAVPGTGTFQYQFFDDFTPSPPGVTVLSTGTSIPPAGGTHVLTHVGDVTVGSLTKPGFLIARHACKTPVRSIFQDGVVIPSDDPRWGVTIWAPGFPGWPLATSYVDIGPDITGARYSLVLADGEIAAAAIDGSKRLSVNTDGIEHFGDGSGSLIVRLALQALHFAINFLSYDVPVRYNWMTQSEVFEGLPDHRLVNEATFLETDQRTESRIVGGYIGAGVIGLNGEAVTAEEVLARFCTSGDFETYFDRKGRLCLSSEPVTAPVNPVVVDDVINIIARTFSSSDQVTSDFFNVRPFVDTRDGSGRALGGWFSTNAGATAVRDETSISNYQQEISAGIVELHFGWRLSPQGKKTIESVMGFKLRRTAEPRRKVPFQIPLSGTGLEPGDAFQVSTVEGPDASGWQNHWVRVMRHELDITRGNVLLDCYDLDPAGAFSHRVPLLVSTLILYPPSLSYTKVLALPTIASTIVRAPSVASVAVLALPTIAGTVVHAPSVIAVLSLPQINTTALYAPTVALV